MSFSESSLYKKFNELNSTQQSVQTLSLWLIHQRKHSHAIVKTWLKELISTTKPERKLTFIYLANDILQNSRKKGNEYMKEFAEPLNEAIENTAKYSDEKIRFTLERILNIWKDRKIYPDDKIDQLKKNHQQFL
jgi:regulator of Ty1 transposition protein 103